MAVERWRDMAGVTKERNKHELWAFILIGLFPGVEEQGKLGYSDLPMVWWLVGTSKSPGIARRYKELICLLYIPHRGETARGA